MLIHLLSSYILQVRATDNGPGHLFVDFAVEVTIVDMNDPPSILLDDGVDDGKASDGSTYSGSSQGGAQSGAGTGDGDGAEYRGVLLDRTVAEGAVPGSILSGGPVTGSDEDQGQSLRCVRMEGS